jgi:hypothetical protein
MKRIKITKMFFEGGDGFSAKVPDHWPPLKKLQRCATLALKSVGGEAVHRLSVEDDDLLITMRALADPRKTAAIYFAMAQAMRELERRPLSQQELVEAKEISEGLQRARLTDEERQAVEHLAQRRA